MRTEITKIHQTVGVTFIYVTHDQVEAMTMATRIVVMKDGFTQQIDSPQNLYDKPVNIFVAGFIGTPQMNFVNVVLEKRGNDAYIVFGDNAIKLPAEKAADPSLEPYFGKEVIAGIRPELIHDEQIFLDSMPDNIIDAKVDVTELMGAEIYLYLAIDGVECFNLDSNKGENIKNDIIAKVSSRSGARAGDTIRVAIDASRIHLFDKDTQKYIIH